MISDKIVEWLIEQENPSVRYRTLGELLNRSPDNSEVRECKNQISEFHSVRTLLDRMHPDDFWLQKNPRTGKIFSKGVEYGAFGTTHYCLSYLAERGMDRNHLQITKAAERYLNLQQRDGDFLHHFSCLLGSNIRTLTMLGYKDDPRVKLRRKEFLELVEIANPRIFYHHPRIHFFAFDGFVMYTFECEDNDFLNQTIMNVVEFSNYQWSA